MKITDLPVDALFQVLIRTLPQNFRRTPLFKSSSALDITRRHWDRAPRHIYYDTSEYISLLNQLSNFARTNMQFYRAVRMYQNGIHMFAGKDLWIPDRSWDCDTKTRRLKVAKSLGVDPADHPCPSPLCHTRTPLRSVDLSGLQGANIPAMRKCLYRLCPTLTTLVIGVKLESALFLHKIPFAMLHTVSLQMVKPGMRSLQMILGSLSELLPTEKTSPVRILNISYNTGPKPGEEWFCLAFPRLDAGLSEFTASARPKRRLVFPPQDLWFPLPVISDIRDALEIRWRRSYEPIFIDKEMRKLLLSCKAWERRGKRTWKMKKSLNGGLDEKAISELQFDLEMVIGEKMLWRLISIPQLRRLTVRIADSDLVLFRRLCTANAHTLSVLHLAYHRDGSSSKSTQVFSKIYAGLFELKQLEEVEVVSKDEELKWDMQDAVRCTERFWKNNGNKLVCFRLRFHDQLNSLNYHSDVQRSFLNRLYNLAPIHCRNLAVFEIKFWYMIYDHAWADFRSGAESMQEAGRKLEDRIPGLLVH